MSKKIEWDDSNSVSLAKLVVKRSENDSQPVLVNWKYQLMGRMDALTFLSRIKLDAMANV